jgi:NTE family protein
MNAPTALVSGRAPDPSASSRSQPVTLALQGGGSLGAFAWGVLDRLLDVPGLRMDVVSGASAGAMNAALLVQGLATGGPAEAKRLLEAFWRRVAVSSGSLDVTGSATWLFPFSGIMAPMADALRQTTKGLSRQQINPLGLNPLRAVLEGLFDPSVLGRDGAPSLVVSATRVSNGEARLFRDAEITAEVLLASSCLPQLFPAVEVDGEFYWDGGFASNPPLRALIEAGAPADIILVRTTPQERPDLPTGAAAILERTEEMTFGATLRQEFRSLALAQRLLVDLPTASGVLARLRDARLHVIGAEEEFRALKIGSHQDASWAFLQEMRELGHSAAERWLAADFAAVGLRSTFDLSSFAQPSLETPLGAQPATTSPG